MSLATATFLPNDIIEATQIRLPLGLLGLSELSEFVLEPISESWPLMSLRSQGELELEFIVVEPGSVFTDYGILLSDEEAASLGLANAADALILNIVNFDQQDPMASTVNLAGPIVLNRTTLLGRQIVLSEGRRQSTRHPLMQANTRGPAPELHIFQSSNR